MCKLAKLAAVVTALILASTISAQKTSEETTSDPRNGSPYAEAFVAWFDKAGTGKLDVAAVGRIIATAQGKVDVKVIEEFMVLMDTDHDGAVNAVELATAAVSAYEFLVTKFADYAVGRVLSGDAEINFPLLDIPASEHDLITFIGPYEPRSSILVMVEFVLRLFDRDDDRIVTPAEVFSAAYALLEEAHRQFVLEAHRNEALIPSLIRKHDADGTRTLSFQEATAMLQADSFGEPFSSTIKDYIHAFDRDKDGQIDAVEFTAGIDDTLSYALDVLEAVAKSKSSGEPVDLQFYDHSDATVDAHGNVEMDDTVHQKPAQSSGAHQHRQAEHVHEAGGGRAYFCRICGGHITDSNQYLPIPSLPGKPLSSAVMRHTEEFGPDSALISLQNPHGVQHDFYTFKRAAISRSGDSIASGSYFPDYVYEMASCPKCGAHLGWVFHESVNTKGNTGAAKQPKDQAPSQPARAETVPHVPTEEPKILQSLNGQCLVANLGWWSYEWCHLRHVRQFHLDPTTGREEVSWSLGNFRSARRSEGVSIDGTGYYSSHMFVGGQHCDETGAGRKSEVMFLCCPDRDPLSFHSITEPSTCSYRIGICVRAVCQHTPTPSPTPFPPSTSDFKTSFVALLWSAIVSDSSAPKEEEEAVKTDRSALAGGIKPVPYRRPLVTWNPKESAPRFYDVKEAYPFLEDAILPHAAEILAEMKEATRWYDWPEQNLYKPDKGHDWKVFPFCYTFPGNDPSKTEWVEASMAQCPFTTAVLKSIPGLRTALFSRLGPHTILGTHQGWADLANHVLRIHLPLIVPSLAYLDPSDEAASSCGHASSLTGTCGIVVDGETVHHHPGRLIVFDDSKRHYAFNNHPTHSRVVLIFDIARPEGLPLGEAEGSTTAELQAFIDYFK